jgi:hypothetical protein
VADELADGVGPEFSADSVSVGWHCGRNSFGKKGKLGLHFPSWFLPAASSSMVAGPQTTRRNFVLAFPLSINDLRLMRDDPASHQIKI